MSSRRLHKLPNLSKSRHGVWYFRHTSQGVERRFSLGTKDWALAKILALRIHLERASVTIRKFDVVLPGGIEVRNLNTVEDLDRFRQLAADRHFMDLVKLTIAKQSPPPPKGGVLEESPAFSPLSGAASPARTKPFSECVALYVAEKRHDNSHKTLLEKQATFDEFQRLFGNKDLNAYGSEQAISYKNRQISDGLSALRINKCLGFLRDFFAYAINHKLYFQANPFQNLGISRKSKLAQKIQSYEAFSDSDLKTIFESEDYKGFMGKPDYYWLPILALYSGARIEELASLNLGQIRQEDGLWFFKIEKAKNRNSIRKIPLHPKLFELGFEDYIQSVADKGGMLFPHLKPSVNGYSKNCSRRFGLYLERVGITDTQKVFHSFRATFINRMTYLNTHPAILMAIVGHYEQGSLDLSSPHFSVYQKNKPLAVLSEAVAKLHFDLNFDKRAWKN